MEEENNINQILRDGNNKFTEKMFHEVLKTKPDENVVLSALSVMPPLAQLTLASVGESHDELLESIGMPNDNVTKAVFSAMNMQLRKTKGVTLKTANKIYVAEGYELNSEFASATREVFESEVQSINFLEKKKTADEINSWVEEQTNNKIKDLVSPDTFTAESRALFVNAIYFKGAWKEPFDTYATTDRDFHISKDKVIQVPTMFKSGNYKYVKNIELQAQILEIPYEGDEVSFVIVLPDDVDGIYEVENKLKDLAVLDKAMRDLISTDVEIYVPKFKIETTTDLTVVLKKMGITKIFDSKTARLNKLLKSTDKELYIDSAIQKAYIEINEEGAEAAAANAFAVGASALWTPPPVFKADRPFYYAIKTKSLILFNGVFIN